MIIIVILVLWALIAAALVGAAFAALTYLLALVIPAWAVVGVVAGLISFPLWYNFFAERV